MVSRTKAFCSKSFFFFKIPHNSYLKMITVYKMYSIQKLYSVQKCTLYKNCTIFFSSLIVVACALKIPSMLSLMSFATDYSTIPAMFLIHAISRPHQRRFGGPSAAQHGIPTSVKNVHFADSHSQQRADLATCQRGLVPRSPRLNFGPSTLLVLGFELGHT